MRTALLQVKEDLGAEAVIMSNKKVAGGVAIGQVGTVGVIGLVTDAVAVARR